MVKWAEEITYLIEKFIIFYVLLCDFGSILLEEDPGMADRNENQRTITICRLE